MSVWLAGSALDPECVLVLKYKCKKNSEAYGIDIVDFIVVVKLTCTRRKVI